MSDIAIMKRLVYIGVFITRYVNCKIDERLSARLTDFMSIKWEVWFENRAGMPVQLNI